MRKPLEEFFLIAYRRSLFFCEPPDSRGQVMGRGGKESGRFVQKEKVLARDFHGSPAAHELNPRLVFNSLEFAHVTLAHGRLAQGQAACFLRSTN